MAASTPSRLVDENDDPITPTNPLPVEIIGGGGGGGGDVNVTQIGGTAVTLGQKTMAQSIPVVWASDQTGAGSAVTIVDGGDVNAGSTADAANTTGTTGTLSGKLRGLIVLFVNFLSRFPAALGAGGGLKVDGSGTALPVSGTVAVSNLPATQPVSGTVAVSNFPATQPISAAALPLPAGAATETTIAAISTKTPALGQAVMASSSPVVIASNQSVVPVSAASLPLPTGAATETTLAAQSAKLPAVLGQGTMAQSLAVTVASNQSDLPVTQKAATVPAATTMQNAAVANGNGTSLSVTGYATAVLNVVSSVAVSGGTTINFEASVDDTTWVAIMAHQVGVAGALATTTTADGDYRLNVSGYKSIRARISAYSAGTITVKGYTTPLSAHPTTVTVGAMVPGVAATSLGKAEDAVHVSGDTGVMGLGVRSSTPTALAPAGDYHPVTIGDNGETFVGLATRLDSVNDSILAIKGSSLKATYRTAIVGLAPAAAATNLFQIIGSATKTVKILAIRISGVATAAGAYAIAVRKQSTADSAGTSTAPAIVPLDSASAAATAAVKAYTANPTLGTLVGLVAARRATVTTAAGAIPNVPTEFLFGESVGQELVLRGVAQSVAISLEGATMTGGALDVEIEFTEE